MNPSSRNSQPLRLSLVVGTRPEAIKLLPVWREASRHPERFVVRLINSGQHGTILDDHFAEFEARPDVDFKLMRPQQSPAALLARSLQALDAEFDAHPADLVMVQGDTTTALAGALAASFRRLPVAHVEAGLRSFDRAHPWPEEDNRVLVSRITDLHFPPTSGARDNLVREGISKEACLVTGNTAIDHLLWMRARQREEEAKVELQSASGHADTRHLLLTCHRRESFGSPLESICKGVLAVLDRFPDTHLTCTLHPNPRAHGPIQEALGDHPRTTLLPAQDYASFVALMARSYLILSDSGGVQEEAPSLGSPVLVLRQTTERPEAVESGCAELVGTDAKTILQRASRLLEDPAAHAAMAEVRNPFGDGHASERILDHVWRSLK